MGAPLDQLLETRAIFQIVAIAQEDDPVGLAAVFIIDVPVGRELLERDQQVITTFGTAADHRAKQRQIEWIDDAILGRALLEKQ